MSNPAVEPVRSINWPASLVFVITGAIALVVAPWYGFTHGLDNSKCISYKKIYNYSECLKSKISV